MPAKPVWYGQLESAIQYLERLPFPWVDRSTLEQILGVGRRRAQQILQPLTCRTIGRNGLAHRNDLIRHLRQLALGEQAYYEQRRRLRLATLLEQFHRDWLSRPRVLVEPDPTIQARELKDLPHSIALGPGRIVIEGFGTGQEALQHILALVLAAGRDPSAFDDIVRR